jgi:4-hydroxyacetophenone monooxygenase
MTYTDVTPQASVSDEELAAYLEDAHLITLLPALAYATGDLSLLRPEYQPDHTTTPLGFRLHGGLSPEQADEVRALAASVIRQLQERGNTVTPPDTEGIREIFQYMVGGTTDEYFPLLVHELGVGEDESRPTWTKSELAPDRRFTVAVIGAGLSGLAAAYRLKQAEIPYVILERNADVGGVWQENIYPGCRLDTSNFAYSYSYAQSSSWLEAYSSREEVWGYLHKVAEDNDFYPNIRFNTAVESAVFDEDAAEWDLNLDLGEGRTEKLRVNMIVSAVGQLNQPNYPNIEGVGSFQGPAIHTARWDHSVELEGKRIGVIGTGASAFQVIQKMAEIAESVEIFQRTAPWVVPTPGYTSPLKPGLHWLFENVPYYDHWYRVFTFWGSIDSRRPYATVDPDWHHPLSVSKPNEELRQALMKNLEEQLGDRPDLMAKMTPHYPPYSKRTLRDDGNWMQTLKRDNVEVVVDPIERIVENGVITKNGELHEFDVLIYGTGFRASEFLSSLSLTGVGGVTLSEQWAGDSRAYYGMAIPNFPNLFCLFGPNTSQNANGSIVMFSESASDYVVEAVRYLLESGNKAMDIHWDVYEAFNERIDAANKKMVYGATTVNSWYKNANGRVTALWPLNCIEFFNATRHVNVEDYRIFP